MTTGSPGGRELARDALRLELAPLVGADERSRIDRRLLVRRRAVRARARARRRSSCTRCARAPASAAARSTFSVPPTFTANAGPRDPERRAGSRRRSGRRRGIRATARAHGRERPSRLPTTISTAKPVEVAPPAARAHEAADVAAAREERANDVRADESGAAGDEVHRRESMRHARIARAHPRRFQAARRSMSPGCFGSSRTTDASKPECIAQFWQRSSCRDSQ